MKRRSILCLLLLACQPVLAQENFQGLLSDIDGLERHFQAPGDPSAPLVQRLTNLEQRLFGGPRNGSMIERLNGLKSAASQAPPQNQYTGGGPPNGGWAPNSAPQNNGWNPNQQNTNGGWAPNQAPSNNPGASGWNNNQNNGWNPNQQQNPGNWRPPQNQSNMPYPINDPGSNKDEKFNPNAKINAGPGWTPSATPPPELSSPAQNPSTNQAVLPPAGATPVPGWQPGMELQHPGKQHNQNNHNQNHHNQAQPNKPANLPPANQPPAPENSPSNIPNAQPMRMVSTPIPVPGAGLVRKNYTPDALPLLNAFPPNLVRMEPDNTALIARPDYYNDVLKASKGRAIRYKNMPVPVYIQPFPDKAFMNCVVRAFESWEMRTGGAVRFVQIDNPNQARIQVVWKHLGGDKDKSGCLLGAHTILKYTNHGNGSLSVMSVGAVPVPIYIPRFGPKYTVPPQVMEVNLDLINTKEQSVKYQCLQNIVTHELGHALGMLGHSPNQADIMFPVTDEHSRLSQRDINTVKKLYNQKCDLPL